MPNTKATALSLSLSRSPFLLAEPVYRRPAMRTVQIALPGIFCIHTAQQYHRQPAVMRAGPQQQGTSLQYAQRRRAGMGCGGENR